MDEDFVSTNISQLCCFAS